MLVLFIIIGVLGFVFGGVLIFFGAKSVQNNKKERENAPVVVTKPSRIDDKIFVVSSCSFKYNKENKDLFATNVLFKGKMSSLDKKEEVEDEK